MHKPRMVTCSLNDYDCMTTATQKTMSFEPSLVPETGLKKIVKFLLYTQLPQDLRRWTYHGKYDRESKVQIEARRDWPILNRRKIACAHLH